MPAPLCVTELARASVMGVGPACVLRDLRYLPTLLTEASNVSMCSGSTPGLGQRLIIEEAAPSVYMTRATVRLEVLSDELAHLQLRVCA
jgi:hypothetical protein